MQTNFKAMFFTFLLSMSGLLFFTIGFSQNAFADGTFISAPNRVDMVYDSTRNILYITSDGSVLRYSLETSSFLPAFELGGKLMGIDISPDNNILAVADHNLYGIHLVNLKTGESKRVTYTPAYDRGSFAVAFGGNNTLLITASGGTWVPLRKYDLISGIFTVLVDMASEDAMVCSSADQSVIGFAEAHISDGRFGRYRTADADIIHRTGYEEGTAWYNYEIAVSRNASQYAIPTYGGTFLTDSNLTKFAIIGDSTGGQPLGAVYNPLKDIVYLPWSSTSQVYAYDTNTLLKVGSYDFENNFDFTGNAYGEGRIKISKDGRYLFVSVKDGIRYMDINLTANKAMIKKLVSPDPDVHLIKAK